MTIPRTVAAIGFSFVFGACQGTTNPAPEPMPPAPMGETAAVVYVQPARTNVETDWVYQSPITMVNGQPSRFRVKLVYAVDVGTQLLAEQCVQANWQAACELAMQQVDPQRLQQANLQEPQARQRWENDLKQQFTDVLFPCDDNLPLANVTALVWRISNAD